MAEFSKALEKLNGLDIDVVALSVDSEEDAKKAVEKRGVTFPVLYGLDARKESEKIGSFIEEKKGFFHATNFILKDGVVRHATYSTGPLGRLQADHVAGLVGFYQKQDAGG